MKQSKNLTETLEIQKQLTDLQSEIESVEGRMKYLNDQVNYSTLELNISQKKAFKYTPPFRQNFFEKLKQSLSRGWYGFVDLFFFLLSNWAVLILLAVLIWLWIKYRKRRKSRKQKE